MKGNEQIIAELNSLLAEELTAINQYMVHAEMAENWGYERLQNVVQKRAIDEMKHAEKLIARVLFLEGLPIVSRLNDLHIGPDVPKQIDNDAQAEYGAVAHYNRAIKLCYDLGDSTTRELLEHIEKEEEDHVDTIESQLDQIKQMGLPVFLNVQVEE